MQSKASVVLGYGSSGTTKSSQIKGLVDYTFDKWGLKTRVITADGGFPDWFEAYQDAGRLEVFPIGPSTPDPTTSLDFYCQGYTPTVKKDAAGKLTNVWTKDGLETIGAFAFEGMTSFGDLIMGDLRGRGARLSQDPNFTIEMGNGLKYYGSNMTYYQFVQDRIYELVMKTHQLPVKKVYWTALETKGEDDGSKTYGPSIAGKKSIAKAPQWFGDCLHFEMLVTETVAANGTTVGTAAGLKATQISLTTTPVMYLKPHADKVSKIPFPAKVRVAPEFVKEVPEYFDPPSLRRLFEMQDDFKARLLASLTTPAKPVVKEVLAKV